MTMKNQDKTKRNSAAKYLHVNEVDISNPAVRCPVILLLDTSKSMKGQPIKELEDGLCQLITEIQNDITASNSVELCIVTLDEHATVQLPFTPAMDLVPRKLGLTAAGGTFTGKALDRAYEQLVARRKQYAENGIFSYAPWVILMSDGKPGDSWQGPAENLLALVKKLQMLYIGVAIGDKANTEIMKKMLPPTPGPLTLSHLQFKEFFRWLSDSLSAVSCSCVSEPNVPKVKNWNSIF